MTLSARLPARHLSGRRPSVRRHPRPRLLLATPLLAGLLASAGWARAADLAPEIVEDTDRALVFCQELGGTPSILPSYERRLDLNGDGRDDVVTDQSGLACEGAASAFCGSAGCPVSAWLTREGAGLERFDFGYLQGYAVVPDAGPGGRPGIRAGYHGISCGEDRVGADGCTRLWVFTDNAPETPPVEAPAEASAEAPAAPPAGAEPEGTPAAAPAARPPAPMPEGWTLRQVPGGDPVALAAGPGDIATLAVFCLEGAPFLALTFHEKPAIDPVPVDFAFPAGPVGVSAAFEATAGGAYVVALADSPLAARLGGRDSTVPVAAGGRDQGTLSLKGSTRALRGALAACGGF